MTLKCLLPILCLFFAACAQAAAPVAATTAADAYEEQGYHYLSLMYIAARANSPAPATGDEGKKLIADLSDEQHIMQIDPAAPIAVSQLKRICTMAENIRFAMITMAGHVYLATHPDLTQFDPQDLPKVAQNVHNFHEALTRMEPFAYHCLARSAQALMASTPADPAALANDKDYQAALLKARIDILYLYTGVLQLLPEDRMDESYFTSATQAAAETAPTLTALLPVKSRTRVRELLDAGLPKSGAKYQPYLKVLGKALDNQECGPLCRN